MHESTPIKHIPYIGNIQTPIGKSTTTMYAAPWLFRLRKASLTLLGGVVLGGIVALIGGAIEAKWLEWTGIGLLAFAIMYGFYASAWAVAGPCPFCGATVGLDMDVEVLATDKNEPVECPHCHEWSISSRRTLRPIDAETFEAKSLQVRAPVFEYGEFPHECLTCGVVPTRYDGISKTSLQAEWLLLGGIVTNKSYVAGIPYCDNHADQIKFYYLRGKSRFRFQDLQAMRRYLVVNAGKKPVQPPKDNH